MSTGKRLAKRSILGTRVACALEDGKYYPGMICNVRTMGDNISVYSVRVEGTKSRPLEFRESELIGPGFSNVASVKLRKGQKVYITHNNREVVGSVLYHRPNIDEVLVSVISPETSVRQDVKKRLDEVRLLESRKSARLADQDTDFAKLADMATERKERKASQTIDVPIIPSGVQGSRKRRSSPPPEEDQMDECAAALVLMKLSCSPRSPVLPEGVWSGDCMSPGSGSSVSSGISSWASSSSSSSPSSFSSSAVSSSSSSYSSSSSSRSPGHRSATPSPPLSETSPLAPDDGLDLDDSLFDDAVPRKRRSSTRTMFKCTWPGCREMTPTCAAVEGHIRTQHLGRERPAIPSCEGSEYDYSDSEDDHEEEFYWTEVEVNVATWVDPCEPLTPVVNMTSLSVASKPIASTAASAPVETPAIPFSPPTPTSPTPTPHAIPQGGSSQQSYIHISSPPTMSHMDMARPPHEDPEYRRQGATLSSSWPRSSGYMGLGKMKARVSSSPKASPGARGKRNGESRKCRKVYGMEQRDLWCTQCKWKKACTRFGE